MKEGTLVERKKSKKNCLGCIVMAELSNSPIPEFNTVYTSAGIVRSKASLGVRQTEFLTIKELPGGRYCKDMFKRVAGPDSMRELIKEINSAPVPKVT